ncbi:MAG: DUF5320 domain-containing protein [Fibrobacterota bacterium]
MPRGDGTGPMGLGSMSGRGAGYCAGYDVPGFMNRIPGMSNGMRRGFGRGFGMGMAWRRGWAGNMPQSPLSFYANTPNAVDEIEIMKGQAKYLSDTLQAISQRITELESKK